MIKIDHISVRDIQTIDFVKNNRTLDRVSILFHEIFRINVELNFDLKFWCGILSKAFKKIWRPISGKIPANFRIWPLIVFKGLTQNSTRKLEVEIQFYVDSENFLKKH